MKYEQAKNKFIQSWGTLGTNWGINRTMAQIHALLLVSTKSLSTEEIMHELKVSRGNANMNIRALMDWGLAEKELKPGQRKEYFFTNKDIHETSRKIIENRRKKEIDPVLKIMQELEGFKGTDKDSKELRKIVSEINKLTGVLNKMVSKYMNSDSNWLFKSLVKIMG
ncbi:MAG: transcriptional regulator [Bacteroidia bacterium]|nr:transcriptional regulator [Bacteroidia bacterium]